MWLDEEDFYLDRKDHFSLTCYEQSVNIYSTNKNYRNIVKKIGLFLDLDPILHGL